ncbi:MAG: sigma 54-interacting transcriptional regulator [Myxococcales bacterium]|nr:sigma 54-interacting transcriptional regulator [Myxococcales bacterium]
MNDESTESMSPSSEPRGPATGPYLRLAYPPELAGESLRVPIREGLVVGRSERMAHGTLSRRHASIRKRGVGVAVRDLQSRNGTFVDGQRVEGEVLAMPGAVLRFGEVIGAVELHEEDAPHLSDALPGASARMRALRRSVARVAAGVAPVLVLGETGTGKDHVARTLHAASSRGGPYVAFNCAGLTPTLADSQLFGHRKGAFTGASEANEGLFRAAHRGTLFLDEVAELDLAVQSKLLRALEDGRVIPVGGTEAIAVDVRVVAATHPSLHERVAAGTFRRDLFARLAIAEIAVPELRERRVDVPTWLERLDARWCEREGGPPLVWSALAIERVMLAEWPEHLRGLDRLVYGLRIRLGPGAKVTPRAVEAQLAVAPSTESTVPSTTSKPGKPSREELERVLVELHGSVRAAAAHFRCDRKQIYRWLDAYGLRR